jgi:hypothetical protein
MRGHQPEALNDHLDLSSRCATTGPLRLRKARLKFRHWVVVAVLVLAAVVSVKFLVDRNMSVASSKTEPLADPRVACAREYQDLREIDDCTLAVLNRRARTDAMKPSAVGKYDHIP